LLTMTLKLAIGWRNQFSGDELLLPHRHLPMWLTWPSLEATHSVAAFFSYDGFDCDGRL